jgi:hypothetical protein
VFAKNSLSPLIAARANSEDVTRGAYIGDRGDVGSDLGGLPNLPGGRRRAVR